jgi:hypothetical protein
MAEVINGTTNTAGLMLECSDTTEIAVHDSGAAVHSLMYYSTNGNITIGRNMGWNVANTNIAGNLGVKWLFYMLLLIYIQMDFYRETEGAVVLE